ncbi:hypothetical protein FGO68_gene13532 [Halteria grandinella]|uniref:Conserved oligomeric Golgi complex subunit 5 helical domain-containing protein n=1 Tax=Halteria grandinella TaxID=5974 RepID=A0A8J8P390_HALGN|nr:hypothetical protein FGO68_gene13532 [Halteria grandinella]
MSASTDRPHQSRHHLSGLLRDTFDEATFLYDLYKTSTAPEVSNFKYQLDQAQGEVIGKALRELVSEANAGCSSGETLCRDIIRVKAAMEEGGCDREAERLGVNKERIEQNMIGQIDKAGQEVVRLNNILKTEMLLKEIQQIAQLVQKVGYAYNFSDKRILDPLSLSVTLKHFNSSQNETVYSQLVQIPEVKEQIELLTRVRQELNDQSLERFQECFEGRDMSGIIQSIQVFFNLEILSDQIQARVNMTLRSLFNQWKTQIQSLNEKLQQIANKDEENSMVDKAISVYVNEMIKQTLRVYTLSMALSERDPTQAYDSINDSLEKSGLSNLFNLYWEKLVHILKQSLQKIEQTELFSYLFTVLSNRYFVFLNGISLFWSKVLDEIHPSEKILILELKSALFESLTVLKLKYVLNVKRSLASYRGQLCSVLQDFKQFGRYMNQSPGKQEGNHTILNGKLSEMLDAMNMHLATTLTQVDIKEKIEEIIGGEIRDMVKNDLQKAVIQVGQHSEEKEVEIKFNWIVYSLAEQLESFINQHEQIKEKVNRETIQKLQKQIFKIVIRQLEEEIRYSLGQMFENLELSKPEEREKVAKEQIQEIIELFIKQKISDYDQLLQTAASSSFTTINQQILLKRLSLTAVESILCYYSISSCVCIAISKEDTLKDSLAQGLASLAKTLSSIIPIQEKSPLFKQAYSLLFSYNSHPLSTVIKLEHIQNSGIEKSILAANLLKKIKVAELTGGNYKKYQEKLSTLIAQIDN